MEGTAVRSAVQCSTEQYGVVYAVPPTRTSGVVRIAHRHRGFYLGGVVLHHVVASAVAVAVAATVGRQVPKQERPQ